MNHENEKVIEIQAASTPIEWNPDNASGKQKISGSLAMLLAMEPGQIRKIIHRDVACDVGCGGDGHCTLASKVSYLRRQKWDIEYYHEEQYVAVFKRVK